MVLQQHLQCIWMTRFDIVFIMLQNELDFAVRDSTLSDKADDRFWYWDLSGT